MLKLMKYEFKKNRGLLAIFGIGLVLLELFYLYSLLTMKNNNNTWVILSASLLFMFVVVCFFTVFILAILNYSRELNAKSSYLVFMTPHSSYTIIISKLVYTLLLGVAAAALLGILGVLDINLLHWKVPDVESFRQLLSAFFESMNIPVNEILLSLVTGLVTFLISFFSTVTVSYLAVTLSATFLYNVGPKLKGFLSFALFIVLLLIVSKVDSVLPVLNKNPQTPLEAVFAAAPATAFNLVMIIACVLVCGYLLEKKVSL